MAKNSRNWVHYWARFADLQILQQKSFNLDQTLVEIEHEMGFKLLSGDQMMVISALEDRIREVSKNHQSVSAEAQLSLFD